MSMEYLTSSELALRDQANRIRDKANATTDFAESKRLVLLAECLWPSDPGQREVDRMEHQQLAHKYPQTLD